MTYKQQRITKTEQVLKYQVMVTQQL